MRTPVLTLYGHEEGSGGGSSGQFTDEQKNVILNFIKGLASKAVGAAATVAAGGLAGGLEQMVVKAIAGPAA